MALQVLINLPVRAPHFQGAPAIGSTVGMNAIAGVVTHWLRFWIAGGNVQGSTPQLS